MIQNNEPFTTGQIAHMIDRDILDSETAIQFSNGEFRREFGHWWRFYINSTGEQQ